MVTYGLGFGQGAGQRETDDPFMTQSSSASLVGTGGGGGEEGTNVGVGPSAAGKCEDHGQGEVHATCKEIESITDKDFWDERQVRIKTCFADGTERLSRVAFGSDAVDGAAIQEENSAQKNGKDGHNHKHRHDYKVGHGLPSKQSDKDEIKEMHAKRERARSAFIDSAVVEEIGWSRKSLCPFLTFIV